MVACVWDLNRCSHVAGVPVEQVQVLVYIRALTVCQALYGFRWIQSKGGKAHPLLC